MTENLVYTKYLITIIYIYYNVIYTSVKLLVWLAHTEQRTKLVKNELWRGSSALK